jgi:glycosyltransferase involved in cell wall biosynthesis
VVDPLPESTSARAPEPRLTILQSKFAAYLSWSQPFIHHLVMGLDPYVRNIVACNRTENLDRFPVKEVIRFPDRYLFEPRLAVLAAAHVKSRFAPDVIHAHFGWSGLRMLLLKQFLRIPMVVTFGGRDIGAQMRLPYFDRLYQVLLSACEEIVCVSKDLRGKVIDAGVPESRVRVIYRGTNVEEFHWVDRSSYDPARPLRILMVGRLVEKKGHRFAFEALRELRRRGLDAYLVVVGEGEDYPGIRRMRSRLGLRRCVEFVGSTNHAGVRRYMADADILLHCSITPESGDIEGIPNVVVEAEAMGLPVVATRHGGIVEAVLDGSTGLLVGERDVHALVEALACLIQDRSRRLDMGKAARAFVERDFNLESQVREHLAIYGEMKAQERAGLLRARTWIPANYPELVRLTIRNHEEFSVAELLERFIWARRMETRFHEPVQRESRLERLYDLKKYVPQMLKYPVKLMVGRTLATAIEARYRNGAAGEAQETLESLDERVLSFFRGGGEIASGSESWGRIEDMLKSYPQVEHLETESQERGTP